MKITQEIIEELFSRGECAIVKDETHKWDSANSTVLSTPVVDMHGVFASAQVEIGASIVLISGECGEPLHFHSSHLIGLVVRGDGWLCLPASPDGTGVKRVAASKGDVAIIPRGALHLFECDPGGELDYIALELSDRPIDYQKHWTNTDGVTLPTQGEVALVDK